MLKIISFHVLSSEMPSDCQMSDVQRIRLIINKKREIKIDIDNCVEINFG